MYTKSEEDFNKALGFRVMKLRQAQKLSQESLGASLGVRYQMIQKYEGGRARMPSYNVTKCAKLFGVPIDYLLLGEEIDETNGYSKVVLNVADEVAKLPTIGLRRVVFSIAKEINTYAEQDDDEYLEEQLSA